MTVLLEYNQQGMVTAVRVSRGDRSIRVYSVGHGDRSIRGHSISMGGDCSIRVYLIWYALLSSHNLILLLLLLIIAVVISFNKVKVCRKGNSLHCTHKVVVLVCGVIIKTFTINT